MAAISETSPGGVRPAQDTTRRHFWVDIDKLIGLFGKRYIVSFYIGRHLHPRQRDLVNQRTWGNGGVFLLFLMLLAGFAYGMVEPTAYRLGHNALACADASYHPTGARKI